MCPDGECGMRSGARGNPTYTRFRRRRVGHQRPGHLIRKKKKEKKKKKRRNRREKPVWLGLDQTPGTLGVSMFHSLTSPPLIWLRYFPLAGSVI
ncbi:hypothetical protein LY78DRAFT_458750 [Colletotrichum sublineola]|nr:hypothetical protein LY78DRAFT_458750 [Colletotrichum sublineola]